MYFFFCVLLFFFFFCVLLLFDCFSFASKCCRRPMERMEDDKQSSDFCNFLPIFASNNQSIANGRIAAVFAKHASHVHSGTVHVHEVSLHWFSHTTPTILYPPSGLVFLKPSLFLGVYQIYFVLPNPNPGVSTLSLMIVIAYLYC